MRHREVGEEGVRAVTIQFVVDDVVHEQQIGQNAEDGEHGILDDEYRIDGDQRRFNDGHAVVLVGDVRESGNILDDHVYPVFRNIAEWLLIVGRHAVRHFGKSVVRLLAGGLRL